MAALETAIAADVLPDLGRMPAPVRERVGGELVYALRLRRRPVDPDLEYEPQLVPPHLMPGFRERATHAALLLPFDPRVWAVLAGLVAIATTTHLNTRKGA